MRVLNQMFIIGVLTLFVNFSFGQNTVNKCKVVNKDFEGQYLGECKKGLANGKGSLIFGGGQFVYKGSFKNGKMHGKGEMFMVTNGISKSFKKGTWVEDVFSEDIKPYVVGKTINLDRYTVKKIGEGNKVNLNFYQNGGRNNVRALNVSTNNGNKISGSYVEGYENIQFPFKCEVTYVTSNKFKSSTYEVRFEIVINEPGAWEITLKN